MEWMRHHQDEGGQDSFCQLLFIAFHGPQAGVYFKHIGWGPFNKNENLKDQTLTMGVLRSAIVLYIHDKKIIKIIKIMVIRNWLAASKRCSFDN
jgi:hypothetical protein